MDVSLLDAAFSALGLVAEPTRLGFLALGVIIGLVLGVVPGIGAVAGLAIVLPFTFNLDTYTVLAFLMGLSSVVDFSRAITAMLLGESWTAGSAGTVVGEYSKARNGEAGRALGAAYSASAMGGLIGAILLAIVITTMSPALAEIDMLTISGIYIFALAVAASLTGRTPLKALAGVCLGLLIATIGDEPQTGTLRWTFNLIEFWDGVHIIPLALGLFALPELCDLAIRDRPTARSDPAVLGTAMSRTAGIRDTVRCWWLTTRCGGVGAILGAVPGMGAAVINRVAHGRVARIKSDGADISVAGDFPGSIALAASNSARVGGALVPTIAFGVPGSASMVLILSALAFHGPELALETKIVKFDGFYVLVWSIAIANLLGAGICLLFTQQLARIASVRIGVLVPTAIALVFLGAYHGALSWSAIYTLIAGGVLGRTMKRLGWPRTPLLLGFFLGPSVEYDMFASFGRYEWDWMLRPFVLGAFAVALFGIVRPIRRRFLRRRDREAGEPALGGRLDGGGIAFDLFVSAIFASALWISSDWEIGARLMPQTFALAGIVFIVVRIALGSWSLAGSGAPPVDINFDNVTKFDDLHDHTIGLRALRFLAWCLFLLGAASIVGLLPALFLIVHMRFEGGVNWGKILTVFLSVWGVCYVLFHSVLRVSWPISVIGDLLPVTRSIQAINLF